MFLHIEYDIFIKFQKGRDICISMADLCWGFTENSKIL